MNCLHILSNDENQKFSIDFANFFNDDMKNDNHDFIQLVNSHSHISKTNLFKYFKLNVISVFTFGKLMSKYDKFFFHGFQ